MWRRGWCMGWSGEQFMRSREGYFGVYFLRFEATRDITPEKPSSERINSSLRQYRYYSISYAKRWVQKWPSKWRFSHIDIVPRLLYKFTFWWWRHKWLCNTSDDVTIDLAIVTCAREEWHLNQYILILFSAIFRGSRVKQCDFLRIVVLRIKPAYESYKFYNKMLLKLSICGVPENVTHVHCFRIWKLPLFLLWCPFYAKTRFM